MTKMSSSTSVTNKPGISFCIPALDEEILIGRCVRSIHDEIIRAGMVLGRDAEIIVVDNGSTDATSFVAEINGAKVVYEPRRGLLRAKQTGYEASHYQLIAFIDADCMLRSGWIDQALYAFRDSRIAAISGPYRYYDLPFGKYVAATVFAIYGALSHITPTMMGGNSVLRRDVIDSFGGFDTSIQFWSEDTFTAMACSKRGKVRFDLRLIVDSSGRRLAVDGYIKTFVTYVYSHLVFRFTGRAPAFGHKDHR